MQQLFILLRIKFKAKINFIQNTFSVESSRFCRILFLLKEVLSFIITALILVFYYKYNNLFWLVKLDATWVLGLFAFVQLLGYDQTAVRFIHSNLDLYRFSSSGYCSFCKNTVISFCLVGLLQRIVFIVPIVLFSILVWPRTFIYVLLGLSLGFVIRMNSIIYNLVKEIKGKLEVAVSLLKSSFMLFFFLIIFNLGFQLVKFILQFFRSSLNSSNYDDFAVLADLGVTVTNSLSWLTDLFYSYLPVLIVYFTALILVPAVYNFTRLAILWRSKYGEKGGNNLHLLSYRNKYKKSRIWMLDEARVGFLPFYKILAKQNLIGVQGQIRQQLEILVLLIAICVGLHNIQDNITKFILIIWFYFIANANYVLSLVIIGRKALLDYSTKLDLFYWRISANEVKRIYLERLDLLRWATSKISLLQCVISGLLNLLFLDNIWWACLGLLVIILLKVPLEIFNRRLGSFFYFFNFANATRRGLGEAQSDESELVGMRLHLLLKFPFVVIPLAILVLNYLYGFLNVFYVLLLLVFLVLLAYLIDREISQYIHKAEVILEKANVPD